MCSRSTHASPGPDQLEEGYDEAGGDHLEADGADLEGPDDDAVKVKDEDAPKRKRNRSKQQNEGDAKELKPRHLRGKKRDEALARQIANIEAAARRQQNKPDDETCTPALLLQAQLLRLLRPKTRRWAMYEWFYSPVDLAWFRQNAFLELLQVCTRIRSHP